MIFSLELTRISFNAENKESCLKEMLEAFKKNGDLNDVERIFDKLIAREKAFSTGIGYGVAIPHVRDEAVTELKAAVYVLDKEIDFHSIDKKGVNLVIMLIVPEKVDNRYLKLMQRVSEFLRREANRETVINSGSEEKVLSLFKGVEDGL